MTSELVTYHFRSPDPIVPGCQNTGREGEDGVVFQGVEPMVGSFMFVGRTSIVEAVGVLFGLSPDAVVGALETPKKPTVNKAARKVNGED